MRHVFITGKTFELTGVIFDLFFHFFTCSVLSLGFYWKYNVDNLLDACEVVFILVWAQLYLIDEILFLILAWIIYHTNIDEVNISVCELIQRLWKQKYQYALLDEMGKKSTIDLASKRNSSIFTTDSGLLHAWDWGVVLSMIHSWCFHCHSGSPKAKVLPHGHSCCPSPPVPAGSHKGRNPRKYLGPA